MKPFFTCYIEGRGSHWRAACTDFDLTVFGASAVEVEALLKRAVLSYIADANAESPRDRDRLLNRRSPWYVRLAWRFDVFVFKAGALLGLEGRPANRITMPCPA